MEVFLVAIQVFGQIAYSPGQKRDLHIRGAGVGVM
jgi:hypothetical protein